ncbi:other/PEK protein kinase [Wuchereria bancrofti]|uniref:non-specific serine/threonine protein kinase n=2 Tax=Wuchereria bancrofti TaxID=6293 RepID=J9EZP9_WUCBA|nr:other/PEK protein kinase [Wuchereria bancrofti]
MVHIKDCSAIDNPKTESRTSSESEGSDYSIDEEKTVKKQNKNAKDAGSNVDGLNANLTSEHSIFSYRGTDSPGEFLSFGENTNSGNNMDEELEKWVVAPRISTCFSYSEDKSLHSSKRKKNRERTKQFQMEIFFASVIEMLCDGEFEGLNIQFREVLRQVAGHFIHSSYLSEDYEAFRIAIRRRITEALNAATDLKIGNSLTVNNPEKRNYFLSSRYSVDFKEIRSIGRGGFGEVHSNIDDCDYAIKKIQFNLKMSKPVTKIVNEVRLLAVVQHRNIVRYYGAWLELQDVQTSSCEDKDEYSNEEEEIVRKNSSKEGRTISLPVNDSKMDDKDDSEKQFSTVPIKQGRFWTQESPTTSSSTISRGWKMNQSISPNQGLTIARGSARADPVNLMLPHLGTAVMFVQMELCSRTLNDYFAERNAEIRPKIDRQLNRSIMEQLMSAVTHLHSKKIIHRDIKPSNIFLRNERSSPVPSVLLGDFGLACLHRSKIVYSTAITESETAITHSLGVGTSVYAAPEQQNSTVYDSAVDVYSAGIVFFELCIPFGTQMERLEAIGELKKGKMTEEFKTSFPDEAKLIKEMCKEDPQERIHAFEIVSKLGKIGENVESLKSRIQELEKEIVRLRNLLLDNNITEI